MNKGMTKEYLHQLRCLAIDVTRDYSSNARPIQLILVETKKTLNQYIR